MKLRASGSFAKGIHGVPQSGGVLLLPRMRQIEGVSHFMARRPEPHPLGPRDRISITGRRRRDERLVENRCPLAMIRPDIVEHDAAQACALLVQPGKEHPQGPLRLAGKSRPIHLHRIMHFVVAPTRVRPRVADRDDAVATGLPHIEPDPSVDLLDGERLARQCGRTIRMVMGADVRGRGDAGGAVELEFHLSEVRRFERQRSRPNRRAPA